MHTEQRTAAALLEPVPTPSQQLFTTDLQAAGSWRYSQACYRILKLPSGLFALWAPFKNEDDSQTLVAIGTAADVCAALPMHEREDASAQTTE